MKGWVALLVAYLGFCRSVRHAYLLIWFCMAFSMVILKKDIRFVCTLKRISGIIEYAAGRRRARERSTVER